MSSVVNRQSVEERSNAPEYWRTRMVWALVKASKARSSREHLGQVDGDMGVGQSLVFDSA